MRYPAPGRFRAAADLRAHLREIGADFDLDNDVDQRDFGRFQNCFSEAGQTSVSIECVPGDLDDDGRVLLSDFLLFQGCISGPNLPADPDCVP